nr:digestive organ expansion factor homolog [Ipomoea batatas]
MEPWVSCNPGTDTPSLDHFTPYLQCSTRNETNQNSSLGIVKLVCTKLELSNSRPITLCTMEFGTFDNSECSSGCESGWTVYLENSIMAPYSSYNNGNEFLRGKARVNGEEEEEEDLSMVSDASSGPPQVVAEEDYGNDSHGWLQNLKEKASMLDDTASSPIFNCTNNNFTINNQTSLESVVPDFSQGYSTTQFQKRLSEEKHVFMQGQSAYQEFFQSSLLPANQFQQNQLSHIVFRGLKGGGGDERKQSFCSAA